MESTAQLSMATYQLSFIYITNVQSRDANHLPIDPILLGINETDT